MTTIDSPDALRLALQQSRLLEGVKEETVERIFRAPRASSVGWIASQLVSEQLITRWQAGQLLAGLTSFWLGPYKLLSRLGASEQSAVFHAQGPGPARQQWVLKVFDDPRWQQPLRYSELSRLVRLQSSRPHPNIQGPKKIEIVEGLTVVASEFWEESQDTLTLAHRTSFATGVAAEIVRQAAWGLEGLHQLGLSHGNLQLTDVLVRDGASAHTLAVRIINGGIAPIHAAIDQGERTQAPTKVSPTDIATDLFALGCLFYQLINGRAAFPSDRSLRIASRWVTKEKNSPVRELRGKVSIELEAIIDQLFRSAFQMEAAAGGSPAAGGSNEGFTSARQVAEALTPLANSASFSLRNSNRPTSPAERVPVELSPSVDPFVQVYREILTTGTTPWWGGLKRKEWIAAALVLPLLLVGSCLRMREGNGTARIDWSRADREGGSLVVDGDVEPMPSADPMEVLLAAGTHQITLVRPGFRPYREEVNVPAGEMVSIRPAWVSDRPPDVGLLRSSSEAADQQKAWATYLGLPISETNSIGMKMIFIPPGEFMMGSPSQQIEKLVQERSDRWWRERLESETPAHRVRISQPFRMAMNEVTVSQFAQFVTATGYRTEAEMDGQGGTRGTENSPDRKQDINWRNPGTIAAGDHPVANVTHRDAVAFCEWLSKAEMQEYSLPTEAEWEYACRAGTSASWYLGESGTLLGAAAWLSNNSNRQTHVVGQKGANGFGLHDMLGNVEEWVADSYDPNYYARSQSDDPVREGFGTQRVARGGSFASVPSTARSAHRVGYYESDRFGYLGFRVMMRIPEDQLGPSEE